MTVACRDECVFRMCIHELRESRVDKAYALYLDHPDVANRKNFY